MTISSQDFLDSAEKCLCNDDEIGYRNAVSRGYYALYHEISCRMTYMPGYQSNHHAALIDYLSKNALHKNEPFDSVKLKSLSGKLRKLRLDRNEADYDLDCLRFNRDMAEQSLNQIRNIFKDFKDMTYCKTA